MATEAPAKRTRTRRKRREEDGAGAGEEQPLQLADGVELIGEYEGSGYQEPQYLARAGDGQIVQLTPVLYTIADEVDGRRSAEEVAERVSDEIGKEVEPEVVEELADTQLRPPGVLANPDGTTPKTKRRDLLLALRLRKRVIPAGAVNTIARPFTVLFWPPIVTAVVGGFVALLVWVFGVRGVGASIRESLAAPGVYLLVFGLAFASAAFHEIGHAAACRYGGARPGEIGGGVYLAWPAFYTDVTDAYRLSRAGRLRTDLGGIYFNCVFGLAVAAVYALTGFEPLLLVIASQPILIAQQLLPFVRLDGYYIVSDLTGVPDLFSRLGGILRSMIPGRDPEPEVLALKPRVRKVVTVWVVVTVALLGFMLLRLVLHLPSVYATAYDAFRTYGSAALRNIGDGSPLTAVAAGVQSLSVLLAPAGMSYVLARLARRIGTGCIKRVRGLVRREAATTTEVPGPTETEDQPRQERRPPPAAYSPLLYARLRAQR